MVCVSGMPGVTGSLERPTAILTQPKRGWGTDHHVEAVVDWCSLILLTLHVYTIRQKFRTLLSKKIEVNTCFGDGQKVRNVD